MMPVSIRTNKTARLRVAACLDMALHYTRAARQLALDEVSPSNWQELVTMCRDRARREKLHAYAVADEHGLGAELRIGGRSDAL